MRLSCALLAVLLVATSAPAAAPPSVVFVPLPAACSVVKHPTLPVLYVGQESEGTNNLVTYRLNADGSLITESKRACDDYFSLDGKAPSFRHSLKRPAVNAEKSIVYLAAYPVTANSVTTYAMTNNQEFAAVTLDEAGQPAKRLQLFRTDITGTQGFIGIGFDPNFARLWITYYSSFGWIDLGTNGLPISANMKYIHQFWRWQYVPEWSRLYVTRPDSGLCILKLSAESATPELWQTAIPVAGSAWAGDLKVSVRHRKAYVSNSVADKELSIYPLDKEGRLVGVPRSFALGETTFMRCDLKAMMIYSFSKDGLRALKLDDNGLPSGKPQLYPFDCGYIYDVFLDEATGKLYVACNKPPGLAPP
jgi:hypothetical protein